jgi:uncharacterized protein (TIGR00255 family)
VLLSMTGHGEARGQTATAIVSVELRAVNNRFLKMTLRGPDPYHLLEGEIEKAVRQAIKRGTVQVHLHVQRQSRAEDFRLNAVALRAYLEQVRAFEQSLGLGGTVTPHHLLALPGIVAEEAAATYDLQAEWQAFEPILNRALTSLQTMRQEEGRAMAEDLRRHVGDIRHRLEQIRLRAPQVIVSYRDRVLDRVRQLTQNSGLTLDDPSLLKEVALFAERCDIAEEAVRLASHLDQFLSLFGEAESPGRKLDFLVQEMFREINTIGSKANDVEIARQVVEVKGMIEKMREMIQNVE